jgi:hypothetical protein
MNKSKHAAHISQSSDGFFFPTFLALLHGHFFFGEYPIRIAMIF